ncbi:uncharacterized protein [Prorops nasuta]|uniref:uncharacterized protein n=1 Tax=Prorops nasuta TaxID=863751 RepID=UPI0034CFAB00
MSVMSDLPTLRRQRAALKGACTRIANYIDGCGELTAAVVANIEERRIMLEKYFSEYQNVQTSLEQLDEENEIGDRVKFEESYFEISAKIREKLGSMKGSTSTTSTIAREAPVEIGNGSASVRLPKINLVTFAGGYEDWFPFANAFKSLIHVNMTLSDLQKLQYLRSSLSGEAAELIESLELSEGNYAIAWDLLRTRYDNKRIIVRNHIHSIFELPVMLEENARQLRQITDGAARHINALKALECPTEHWDQLLIYILSSKLDPITSREWGVALTTTELPEFRQFISFLRLRCEILEGVSKNPVVSKRVGDIEINASIDPKRRRKTVISLTTNDQNQHDNKIGNQINKAQMRNSKCYFCQGKHVIYFCDKFKALPIIQRINEIRKRKICFNCLKSTDHVSRDCKSGSCRNCKAKHNTLLHRGPGDSVKQIPLRSEEERVTVADFSNTSAPICQTQIAKGVNQIMLSTALINVLDKRGKIQRARVLLDSGSQINLITKSFARKLGIESKGVNISIRGVNGFCCPVTEMTKVELRSRLNSYDTIIECFITERITEKIPCCTIATETYKLPRNIRLADPTFNVSGEVDMLIGAEVFWTLLCVGQIHATPNHPMLQKTRLSWILAGRSIGSIPTKGKLQACHVSTSYKELNSAIKKFWHIEELESTSAKPKVTSEEKMCEIHFVENTYRDAEGRFVVKLPIIKDGLKKLGDSRVIAHKRLTNLERRLDRIPELRYKYNEFMHEYITLGHMKLINMISEKNDQGYYMPHHCITKSNGQGFRVVFDASCPSASGVSLNDILVTGPVIQQDLLSILLRFRLPFYVITADIIKMYRQIMVDPKQTSLQRILWRETPSSSVRTYELATVTYGTSPASFLATRCLKQLAIENSNAFPIGSKCLSRDFYMDDLLTGADSINEIKIIRKEIVDILKKGHFELSKWSSNVADICSNEKADLIELNGQCDSRILGIYWNPKQDTLHFKHSGFSIEARSTKRGILSEISKLFDPLGLLGPVFITVKLIMQELWRDNLAWDESVPLYIDTRWNAWRSQIGSIQQLSIPRCVKYKHATGLQIHGFADASERAYGACVYIRCRAYDGTVGTELLCSKSRVAPLRAISLPRLELCAAVMLAKLVEKITQSLDINEESVILWCDSTITLNWIHSESRTWSTFVANRVGEIQELTSSYKWRHVPTTDNPADLVSRGIEPALLKLSSLWWHGPTFLTQNEKEWPSSNFTKDSISVPERRIERNLLATTVSSLIDSLIMAYSNVDKLLRVVSYCARVALPNKDKPSTITISIKEIRRTLRIFVKLIQGQHFAIEYRNLKQGLTIKGSSKLISLNPFLDSENLIRVGGRLRNSLLDYDARHPLVLPRNNKFTELIIKKEHISHLHAGVQGTMAAVRRRYWPIGLRTSVKKVLRSCIVCFKCKPSTSEAIMGDLPSTRVRVSRPFLITGVDYAGPINIREGKRRNAKLHKAYVAIFVCFVTKACHIEVVSDLTSQCFLAALKRFISRRGRPSQICSDNGTTFVGAYNQLKNVYRFIKEQNVQDEVKQYLSDLEIEWKFIPPYAPHVGGLWEAAVKSCKYHMYRIMGNAHLTYEEVQTILCEIEAILNSRPITPLSDDPNDLSCITPGHFLIGSRLDDFPNVDITEEKEGRLIRWQRVERMRQHFWRRWSSEYLCQLQQRWKWQISKGIPPKINDMFLIRQPGVHPLHWQLGRIEQIHPGPDGVVRTATIRHQNGSMVRSLTKLAILPIDPYRFKGGNVLGIIFAMVEPIKKIYKKNKIINKIKPANLFVTIRKVIEGSAQTGINELLAVSGLSFETINMKIGSCNPENSYYMLVTSVDVNVNIVAHNRYSYLKPMRLYSYSSYSLKGFLKLLKGINTLDKLNYSDVFIVTAKDRAV